MRSLRSNPARTAERYAELERYMSANVTSGPGGFCCVSGDACRASALVSPDVAFYEGQLSHVGEHYDMTDDGHDLRVLVLGMETGRDRSNVTMDQRRAEQQTVAPQDPRSRKPHMKGTASALRLAFGGVPGADVAGDLLAVQNHDEAVHVYDAYALANVRLCSAVIRGTTKSKGTLEMTRRCSPHLEATVRILEPTLVISQSARTREAIAPALSNVEQVDEHLEWVTLAGVRLLLASLVHPYQQGRNAHMGWGGSFSTPYLDDVVAPTILHARVLLLEDGDEQDEVFGGPPSAPPPPVSDAAIESTTPAVPPEATGRSGSRRREAAGRIKDALTSARNSRALDQARTLGAHAARAAAARAPEVVDALLTAWIDGQHPDDDATSRRGESTGPSRPAGPWTVAGKAFTDRSTANRALARALGSYTDDEWIAAQRQHGLR